MVASLPPNIQLKLEQTLHQWRQWRCEPPLSHRPKIVSRFSSGLSNYSVLVEAEQHFVVRIDGSHVATNGLSRASEWRCLKNAHKAGLAPHPRYFNPELGVLVCDFLHKDNFHTPSATETATLLRKIHSLPALHHRLDVRDRILGYEGQLAHHKRALPQIMTACRSAVLATVGNQIQLNEPQVLCHNDLLAANRVCSDGMLRAIDWEYCAMGSAWFDLAVIVIGDELDKPREQALLKAYLQRIATAEEELKLMRYCLIYRYLELLWNLLNTPEDGSLSTRLNALLQQHQQLTEH